MSRLNREDWEHLAWLIVAVAVCAIAVLGGVALIIAASAT